jgi:hypothetical protein
MRLFRNTESALDVGMDVLGIVVILTISARKFLTIDLFTAWDESGLVDRMEICASIEIALFVLFHTVAGTGACVIHGAHFVHP